MNRYQPRIPTASALGVHQDAEVEYIQSSGGQYVAIGVKDISRYVVDFEPTSFSDLGSVISVVNSDGGAWRGDTIGLIRLRTNGYQVHKDNGWATISIDYAGRHVADMNLSVGYFMIDDYRITMTGVFGIKDYIVLSAWTESGQRMAKCKYYGFKVWDAKGMLSFNMVPVRFTNNDGISEGAMYDRVSGLLFRNSGTGQFLIGPDKE